MAHFIIQAGNHPTGLNIAEIALLVLGAVTVIMQLYGFYLRRKRSAASSGTVESAVKEEGKGT